MFLGGHEEVLKEDLEAEVVEDDISEDDIMSMRMTWVREGVFKLLMRSSSVSGSSQLSLNINFRRHRNAHSDSL